MYGWRRQRVSTHLGGGRRRPLSRSLAALLDFTLPSPCLACGKRPASSRLGLCVVCRGAVAGVRRPACRGCGSSLPQPTSDRLCGGCRRRRPPWSELWTVWVYRPPVDSIIQGLKFRRLDYLGEPLAEAALLEHGWALEQHDFVVPVPLHWRRRLQRGYNQAERIAAPLAAALGLPLIAALQRARATAPQTTKTSSPGDRRTLRAARRRRRSNVSGAFRLRRRFAARVRGSRILLVDDVVTTGATLGDATRALRRAGACSVGALAVARTPE